MIKAVGGWVLSDEIATEELHATNPP